MRKINAFNSPSSSSGSNKILEAMNRKHNIKEYLGVEKLIYVKPDIKFSSDFIMGYPGETNEDFEKTIQLIKQIKFINSYSFSTSKAWDACF